MNPENSKCRDEEVANYLWLAISRIQAMTDRLLAQCEKSLRGEGADAYSLLGLTALGARAVRWGNRPGSARPA